MSATITCGWCAEEIPADATRCPKCQGSVAAGLAHQAALKAGTPRPPSPKAAAAPKAPAGWYDHPTMVNTRRYWDGNRWTGQLIEGSGPAPAADELAVPMAASENEWEPVPPSWLARNWWRLAIGVVLVMVFVVPALVGGDPDPGEPGYNGDDISAEVVCEDFVEDRLKAPATADFSDETVSESAGIWTVSGNVDSENSFGAKIRNTYVCQVKYKSGDTWTLVDLQMSES